MHSKFYSLYLYDFLGNESVNDNDSLNFSVSMNKGYESLEKTESNFNIEIQTTLEKYNSMLFMNTTENKHLLWELTKDLYSPGMDRGRVIEMFESTVLEVDVGDEPLLEKNKIFLKVR